MSQSQGQQSRSAQNRRSIRRIKKLMEKSLADFQIPNPYRHNAHHPYFPAALARQLAKLDFLSLRVLGAIRVPDVEQHHDGDSRNLLDMMRVAVQAQNQEFDQVTKIVGQRIQNLNTQLKQDIPSTQPQLPSPFPEQSPLPLIFQPSEIPQEEVSASQYSNPVLQNRSPVGTPHNHLLSDNYEQEMANYTYNFRYFRNSEQKQKERSANERNLEAGDAEDNYHQYF